MARMQAHQPGPHHKLLEQFVGKWDILVKMTVAPGKPPFEFKGTGEHEMIFGGRFVQAKVKFLLPGSAENIELLGYDKTIDVWIELPDVEDNQKVIAGVPEERFAKAMKAAQVIFDMLNDAQLRAVYVGYPTKQAAEIDGLDFATYEKLHWGAVNADYTRIAQQGNTLKQLLQNAQKD